MTHYLLETECWWQNYKI